MCIIFSRKAVLILVFFLAITTHIYAQTDEITSSRNASEQWLILIDKGKYAESWRQGSIVFQRTIPVDRWIGLVKSTRRPLGNVISRKVLDQRTAKDPKGLLPGDYMVLFYDTSFSKKGVAHELVTLVLEKDGQWRVLTYQVQ